MFFTLAKLANAGASAAAANGFSNPPFLSRSSPPQYSPTHTERSDGSHATADTAFPRPPGKFTKLHDPSLPIRPRPFPSDPTHIVPSSQNAIDWTLSRSAPFGAVVVSVCSCSQMNFASFQIGSFAAATAVLSNALQPRFDGFATSS